MNETNRGLELVLFAVEFSFCFTFALCCHLSAVSIEHAKKCFASRITESDDLPWPTFLPDRGPRPNDGNDDDDGGGRKYHAPQDVQLSRVQVLP